MTIHIFGEAMLEFHSSTATGGIQAGGDTLNTAIHLARLGHDVRYVTAVGRDPFSDEMVAAWEAEGIDTRFVLRHPFRHPGAYAIRLDDAGERSFLYWRERSAAREVFALEGIEQAMRSAEAGALVYFSLITLAVIPAAERLRLIDMAARVSARGGLVAYDSNYRAALWENQSQCRAASEQAISCATIGLPTNSDEAQIAGRSLDEEQIADRWNELGCAEVIVKAGESGAVVRSSDGTARYPASSIDVVDTSGAGDAFNAGYLSGRLRGQSIVKSVEIGRDLASWVIGRYGALPPPDHLAPYKRPTSLA